MILFRFTLLHDILGEQVISEPLGWVDTVLKLERHEDFHSLIEYFEGEFTFYGNNGRQNGGAEFIREVERQYGFDTTLGITVELSTDGYVYQTVFIGQLDLSQIEELPDNKIEIPIIRDDFWSKFINRLDTQVDVQSDSSVDDSPVDAFDSINLRLSSQYVRQITSIQQSTYSKIDYGLTAGNYIQLDFDIEELMEIKEKFNYPIASNTERPFELFALEYDGLYAIQSEIWLSAYEESIGPVNSFYPTDPTSPVSQISVYLQINDETPIPFTVSLIDNGFGYSSAAKYTINQSFNLKRGDFIRIYAQIDANVSIIIFFLGEDNSNINSDPDVNPTIPFIQPNVNPFLRITADTVYTESNCESFLLHDCAGAIVDRTIGEDQSFYSELLGSTQTIYRQYDADGCDWEYALARGLQLRRYSLIEKPFFQSFKQWWEGANPILNLGLGYENIDGRQVIRVEDKRHFYDDSEVSVNISNVRDMVRKYDPNRLFKTVRIGYKKWQSEDVSGIDDPQTKRTYASRLQKSGKDLIIESDFIAASLAIETTRRSTREKSADYKFDNDTFIISIRPNPISISPETSPDVTDYEPELDENFSSVQNLLNADTRYNIRLTPARNFLRWKDWLSGGLQAYIDSNFKFTSGEGNFDVITDMANVSDGCDNYYPPLSEKQDISISNDPFHLALEFEINCPLDWDDYILIRDNPKRAIGISQTESNHIKFFIKDLEYSPVKGEVKIIAWPTELMTVEVIETTTTMQICEPLEPCQDSFISEIGDEFVTEDEDCLILE